MSLLKTGRKVYSALTAGEYKVKLKNYEERVNPATTTRPAQEYIRCEWLCLEAPNKDRIIVDNLFGEQQLYRALGQLKDQLTQEDSLTPIQLLTLAKKNPVIMYVSFNQTETRRYMNINFAPGHDTQSPTSDNEVVDDTAVETF